MTFKGTEVESAPSIVPGGKNEEEDDRYEVMKVHGSKNIISQNIDVKIIQEKLILRDAIVIILAVSLSSLPNLIAPMLFGPI